MSKPNRNIRNSKSSHEEQSKDSLRDNINKCVRYILLRSAANLPIKKLDIQKNCLQNYRKNFDAIMNRVTNILRRVYDYELTALNEDGGTKMYILSSKLPCINVLYNDSSDCVPTDAKKILILLILAHIFMSSNPVSEVSLYTFLKYLCIDVERKHVLFGDVKDFIHNTMVKQKYLTVETDKQNSKNSFSWGPRAECSISKHKVLEFACKIYGNIEPKNLPDQFATASQQSIGSKEQDDSE